MSAAKPARQFVHATKIFPSSLKNCEQLISKEMNMILNLHTMTIVGLALLLEYMCKHKKNRFQLLIVSYDTKPSGLFIFGICSKSQ